MTESEPSSALRRISEDKHLRSFLSVHFNADEYVSEIIRQGKSEEIFAEISKSMEDVKEEIQLYITQNKGRLMGGMQGVAALAERYSMLSITSQKLHRSVEKLKREALSSHDVVQTRTKELERIHQTGSLLRQLRQFAHAYGQLEHLMSALKSSKKGSIENANADTNTTAASCPLSLDAASVDVRQLPTVAKLVNELEGLLANDDLHKLAYLTTRDKSIVKFGSALRLIAKQKLLQALKDSDQAGTASCLQIFFNLQSLPDTIVYAVDAHIHQAVELSRGSIDVEEITRNFPDLVGGGPGAGGGSRGVGSGSRTAAALAAVANMGTKSSSGNSRGGKSSSAAGDRAQSEVMLRAALKESAAVWAEGIRGHAMQVLVLQRVLCKMEDASTHVRFTMSVARCVGSGRCDSLIASRSELSHLSHGNLLTLFFARLQAPFGDMAAEKARQYSGASIRLYPYLRLEAVEAANALSASSIGGSSFTTTTPAAAAAAAAASFSSYGGLAAKDSNVGVYTGSLFGALDAHSSTSSSSGGGEGRDDYYYSVGAVLGSSSISSISSSAGRRPQLSSSSALAAANGTHRRQNSSVADSGAPDASSSSSSSSSSDDSSLLLVAALGPIKEKYLSAALTRMTSPVLQMFPELEGYTAAVPSKRDVAELMKALSGELATAAADGGMTLLPVACHECVKAIHLILTKVKNMALDPGVDESLLELTLVDGSGNRTTTQGSSTRAVGSSSGSYRQHRFLRNAAQDHNLQLILLLSQLRESIGDLPASVVSSIASFTPGSSSKSKSIEAEVDATVVQPTFLMIDAFVNARLMGPVVAVVANYTKCVLFGLPSEGAAAAAASASSSDGGGSGNASSSAGTPVDGDGDEIDALLSGCSQAVSRVVKEMPALLSAFVASLPRSGSAGEKAAFEGDSTSAGGGARTGTTTRQQHKCLKFPATAVAIEKLCLEIMSAYISSSALVRPINENWRLRTAKELSALEHAMSTYGGININTDLHGGNVEGCPVYQEFRAFRRFIFREEETAVSASALSPPGKTAAAAATANSPGNPKIGMMAPSLESLLALSYFKHLRPSTVLAYVASCSPSQMPSPYEGGGGGGGATRGGGGTTHAYLSLLTAVSDLSNRGNNSGAAADDTNKNSNSNEIAEGEGEGEGGGGGNVRLGVRALYKSGCFVRDRRGNVAAATSWRAVPQEAASWQSFQLSLDKFLQRISVAEPTKRVGMRAWADSILNIGNYYFGGR
jgi:hypothetical protein